MGRMVWLALLSWMRQEREKSVIWRMKFFNEAGWLPSPRLLWFAFGGYGRCAAPCSAKKSKQREREGNSFVSLKKWRKRENQPINESNLHNEMNFNSWNGEEQRSWLCWWTGPKGNQWTTWNWLASGMAWLHFFEWMINEWKEWSRYRRSNQ